VIVLLVEERNEVRYLLLMLLLGMGLTPALAQFPIPRFAQCEDEGSSYCVEDAATFRMFGSRFALASSYQYPSSENPQCELEAKYSTMGVTRLLDLLNRTRNKFGLEVTGSTPDGAFIVDIVGIDGSFRDILIRAGVIHAGSSKGWCRR
jgi:hypothetical protein